MKHLEDKRVCPSCGHEYHERRYLMARDAEERVPLGPLFSRAAWMIAMALSVFLAVNA